MVNSHSTDEEADISESELEDYVGKVYQQLKDGHYRSKLSNGFFRCPFCSGKRKQEYRYKDMLQHATSRGKFCGSSDIKHRSQHRALGAFLEKYHGPIVLSGSSTRTDAHFGHDRNEKFVWPWKGVVANLPIVWKDGRYVGESGSKLRDDLKEKGFNPLKVIPLWNYRGHSGWAIVDFNQDWEGFGHAMMFEKFFESDHRGKNDYLRDKSHGDKLYGWVARQDDYLMKGPVGEHLCKNADLRSIANLQAEEERKNEKLVSSLTNTIEAKKTQCKEMKNKLQETSRSLSNVIKEKDEVMQAYTEEMRKIQQSEREYLGKVLDEHARIKQQLESRRTELELCWQELKQREAHNDSERRRLAHERKMNELATMEQKKADENMLKLAEKQQRQKEELHQKIIALEKKLDQKQALELEIERMRGAIQVMQHMEEEGDVENSKKVDVLEKEMREKLEELENMEALNQALIIKERMSNDELQEARKELINGLKDSSSRGNRPPIGVKRMGELDGKPFQVATKRKFSADEAPEKAVEVCSLWEDHLRDPSWHPFKVVTENGQSREVIDEEDEKLNGLRSDLGEEAYGSVITALMELNEYNPSGRYPLLELWNFREVRRATLKEAAAFILKQWRVLKRKKT
ncbi:hypothetical protein Ancab_031948 [Ancistrocladus abbreviatus]